MKVYNRNELEQMKRSEIQKLCKEYGVKANLKTEALIELLQDTFNNTDMRPLTDLNKPVQEEQKTRGTLTRSRASSRTTPMISPGVSGVSDGSVLVHDDDINKQLYETTENETSVGSSVISNITRTARAKETQRKLGVGRPVTAGGTGARVSTKKSIPRTKRGKNSRTMVALEETIQEEDTLESDPTISHLHTSTTPMPGLSDKNTSQVVVSGNLSDPQQKNGSSSGSNLTEQVQSLGQLLEVQGREMADLQAEMQRSRQDIATLRQELSRIVTLEIEFQDWRESIKSNRSLRSSPGSSSPKTLQQGRPYSMFHMGGTTTTYTISAKENIPMRNPGASSTLLSLARQPLSRTSPTQAPSPSATTLGKRPRDSISSNSTPTEAEVAGQLSPNAPAQKITRPIKKRAKLDDDEPNIHSGSPILVHQDEPTSSRIRVSSSNRAFFSRGSRGPQSNGTPPPTEHLPEFFEIASEDMHAKQSEDTLHDNDHAEFDFYFAAPTTSTPYITQRAGGDVFDLSQVSFSAKPTFPVKASSAILGMTTEERYLNPNELLISPTRSLTEGEERLRMDVRKEGRFAQRARSPVCLQVLDTPARPMQKTLYGTESEDDTRFGDFGRDGVASTSRPFWLAGKF